MTHAGLSRPVGITAMGYCQHRDDTLAVIDGVQGTVVAAPGCPDVVKRRIQGFAQPVWFLGNWAGQVFIKGRGGWKGKFFQPTAAAGVKKIV
jgi:hypothetical protein